MFAWLSAGRCGPTIRLRGSSATLRKSVPAISPATLRRLTEALAAHRNRDAANAIRLLFLTGARRGEAPGGTWDQFDLTEGVWTKPAQGTKQKSRAPRALSAPARQLLAEMKGDGRSASSLGESGTFAFLFPARRRARARRDGHMVDIKPPWRCDLHTSRA